MAAAFGWLVIVLPTSATALSVALGAAAVVLVGGLAVAPRQHDETDPSPT